ncbi:glycosyltransferase, partial [Thalassospira xiamenensis]
MKILVGIQGTGNGHISRCSALAEAFKQQSLDVDYLVSGRPREALFDMEAFGDWQWHPGLTFSTRNGKVRLHETLRNNQWRTFQQSVQDLDLRRYDLVLSDYEPVTAWAARRQNKRCIGIGRQFAFYKPTGALKIDWWQRQLLKNFAPVKECIGSHWHDIG